MALIRPTRLMWRGIIAGVMSIITFWILSQYIRNCSVYVPSRHELLEMTPEEQAQIIEKLDKELGEGNYKFGEPKPVPGVDSLYKFIKWGLGETPIKSERAPSDTLGYKEIYVVSEKSNKLNRKYFVELSEKDNFNFSFDFVQAQSRNDIEPHLEIWKQISKSDLSGLVLSDLSDLDPNFRGVISTIHKHPKLKNYNVLFLNQGNSEENAKSSSSLSESDIKLVETQHYPGFLAYAVSPNGASSLLAIYKREIEKNSPESPQTDIDSFFRDVISDIWLTCHSLERGVVSAL
ncbi:hypothetical protein BB560_005151 [Smittium megazygosporum]|uniref:Uncharacterized protein n=1 Tax=Smittium megazygosporum TaxID=133381 RepID=A0A2T9Z7E3_9FUNG|nr:hypothetical protein BB560_005151 [Smittium megazygosporum]